MERGLWWVQVGDEVYAFEFTEMACEHTFTYRVILHPNNHIFDPIIDSIHPHLLGGHFPSEAVTAPVAFTFHRDRCEK